MRRSMPTLFLLAALGGCGGGNDAAQDIREVDQQLAGDNLIDNDLTAIDAITGADANMAADVPPLTPDNLSDDGGNTTAARRGASRPADSTSESQAEEEPAEAPAATPPPASAANSSDSN